MPVETADPEQVVHDAFAWLNGDASKIDAVAESVDVYGPALPEGEVHSRAEWAEFIEANRDGFPDIEFSIHEMVAGDDIVMVELSISGTHTGEFMGIPPTDREIEIWAIDKFTIESGKVVEWRPYFDSQEIPKQLGFSFPAVLGQLPKLAWRKIRLSI